MLNTNSRLSPTGILRYLLSERSNAPSRAYLLPRRAANAPSCTIIANLNRYLVHPRRNSAVLRNLSNNNFELPGPSSPTSPPASTCSSRPAGNAPRRSVTVRFNPQQGKYDRSPNQRPGSRPQGPAPDAPHGDAPPADAAGAAQSQGSIEEEDVSPWSKKTLFGESGAQAQAAPAAGASPAASPGQTYNSTGSGKKYSQIGRWRGMDADKDTSDDQLDLVRGRGMESFVFQGDAGSHGTHISVQVMSDYGGSAAKRSFGNIEDGFYIAPSFYKKLSIHLLKNFLDLPRVKVPLILGIWGGKGQGKTFQCELTFKKLGVNPIVMSAGELESGTAGEPGRLIRQRYREAADIIKKGKLSALFINDLDAGVGRHGGTTQYTVNNQLVAATLMNIADGPTNVQLPGQYSAEPNPRVPLVVTGNDFATLYAPLIRDGRMEKFYFAPTRDDRINIALGIFAPDGLTKKDCEEIIDRFPNAAIDFFGACRARIYDDAVWGWLQGHETLDSLGKELVNSRTGKVRIPPPPINLKTLLAYGDDLVRETQYVQSVRLAEQYVAGGMGGKVGGDSPLSTVDKSLFQDS